METKKNWREQLASVEQRLQQVEADAQKRVRELTRNLAARRELEEFVAKVKSGELLGHAAELRARAEQTGNEVLKRFEGIQVKAFERMGIATRPQIAELGAQVSRLSRRLEKLSRQARRWGPATAPRAEEKRPSEDGSAAS